MRVRTELRRQQILDTAVEVLRDVGYERASMTKISARVGGSKTTLYGYFSSKEELFSAAMLETVNREGAKAIDFLATTSLDPMEALSRFGEAYLQVVTSDNAIALTRGAMSEGAHQEASALQYDKGAKLFVDALATYLSKLQDQGIIRDADLRLAASHLEALLSAGIVMPLLFGSEPELERKDALRAAVGTFLKAYAPDRHAEP